ncbi:MAG: hypothetical protein V4556_11495 [Bacteroidota bacterium]
MEQTTNLLDNDLIIDGPIAAHMKETATWAKFLGVTGFILSGVMALGAVGAGVFLSRTTAMYNSGGTSNFMAGGMVTAVYLVIAAITFVMSRFLFLFAKKAQVALRNADQENLIIAFKNLKIYFRFAGIIAIITLIFSVLGAIGLMMAASFSRY